MLFLREPLRAARRDELRQLVLATAARPDALRARIVSPTRSRAIVASTLGAWPKRRSPVAEAAALLTAIGEDRGAAALHDSGVAWLVAGTKHVEAADRLRTAVSKEPRADWWS